MADFAEFELLLDGDIDDPLLYDRIPIEPSECRGVFDAIPVKSSGSLIMFQAIIFVSLLVVTLLLSFTLPLSFG